jgi:predicted secreted protein
MNKAAAALIVCLGILCAGNSQDTRSQMIVVTKADSSKKITVPCGAIIEIDLQEQGGTGYLWQFDNLDREFFDLINIETEKNNTQGGFTGGPISKRWRLKTKKVGETTVRLYYFRPWEDKRKAADKFFLPVRVQ